MKLWCIVEGLEVPFKVQVNDKDDVGDLKNTIKAKLSSTFRNVDALFIKIWKISKTLHEARQLTVASLEGEEHPPPTVSVGQYWPDLTAEVHVFITNPSCESLVITHAPNLVVSTMKSGWGLSREGELGWRGCVSGVVERDGSSMGCSANTLPNIGTSSHGDNLTLHGNTDTASVCDSMDTLVLECWVYGDDSYTTFPVKISRTETVGSLKKVVKDENSVSLNSVDARHLILYSIPMPDDEHFEAMLQQWTFKGQTRLNEQRTLSVLNLSDSLVIVHAPNLGTLIVVSYYPSDK
jgi:hypothetical protein